MTSAPAPLADLLRELGDDPELELTRDAPLAPLNTFRIGGPAELLAEASSERALSRLLAAAHARGVPLMVLGLGSNVLIPDQGVEGVVVRMAGELKAVCYDGNRVTAGAAVPLPQLARRTVGQGLLGLEALAGFPSTVGGAVVMNAGCYGTEICDVLVSTRVLERDGSALDLGVGELGAGYRTTRLQGSGRVVAGASFELEPGDAVAALARVQQLNRKRWASLPSGQPNVGSIFRNPEGDAAGRLIDECGLKGLERGGAQISPKHANVIVNAGGASADDVLGLMLEARERVAARHGVELEPEVVLTGPLRRRWLETPTGRL